MDDLKENNKAEQRKQVQKEIMSLSTAILAGAVIVGVSVLLAANIIVNNFGSDTVKNLGAVAGADSNVVTNVKVTERVGEPKKGGGSVTMYEFSDFQCPFCQNFWNTSYKQIKSKYIDTGKITFIYRHSPLPFHQNAQKSAEASECANAQGKFWEYHDLLFANSKSDGAGLEITDLKKYAKDLGLNTSKFDSCLDGGEMSKVVEEDSNLSKSIGVSGTPTFFINGKQVVGALPYAEFEKTIEEALNQ